MGASAKAILYGTVTAAEVGAALERKGYEVSPWSTSDHGVRLSVIPPDDGSAEADLAETQRLLHVFGQEISSYDNKDVYPGEKTICSLGTRAPGPEIVRILAEEFGGYHLASDAADEPQWVSVEGRREVVLTARESLLVAFQRALPPGLAEAATRMLETAEPERLEDLRDALDAHLAELSAAPRP